MLMLSVPKEYNPTDKSAALYSILDREYSPLTNGIGIHTSVNKKLFNVSYSNLMLYSSSTLRLFKSGFRIFTFIPSTSSL